MRVPVDSDDVVDQRESDTGSVLAAAAEEVGGGRLRDYLTTPAKRSSSAMPKRPSLSARVGVQIG